MTDSVTVQTMSDYEIAKLARDTIDTWRYRVYNPDSTKGGIIKMVAATGATDYGIAMVLQHESVRAAISDPVGARAALLSYGELTGYPVGGMQPIFTKAGKEAWEKTLASAPPLQLGIAWMKVEEREADRRARKETPSTESAKPHEKEKDTMPVIQPTKSLDVGIYPAKILDVDETETTFQGDTQPTKQLRFQFVVLDGDEETDEEIRGYTSCFFGAKTKLYKWAKAILGAKRVVVDQPFDSDRLKGKKCDIAVEMNKQGTNTRVAEVYPYKTASVQAQGGEEDDDREPEETNPAFIKPQRAF